MCYIGLFSVTSDHATNLLPGPESRLLTITTQIKMDSDA